MKNFLFSHRISENPQDTHLGEKVSEPRTQFYFYLYRKLCFLLHSFIHTLIFYRKYHVNENESMIDYKAVHEDLKENGRERMMATIMERRKRQSMIPFNLKKKISQGLMLISPREIMNSSMT